MPYSMLFEYFNIAFFDFSWTNCEIFIVLFLNILIFINNKYIRISINDLTFLSIFEFNHYHRFFMPSHIL